MTECLGDKKTKMKMKMHIKYHNPQEHTEIVKKVKIIPRIGDTIRDTDLAYIVKEVTFDYDRNIIIIDTKRPDEILK